MGRSTGKNLLQSLDLIGVFGCFTPNIKSIKKNEIITNSSLNDDTIGIILEGTIYFTAVNSDGQRRIIDFYRAGEIFGNKFIPSTDEKCFYIIAKTACKIGFVKYHKFIACCSNKCQAHQTAITRLIESTAEKSFMHIDILGQRTIKSKLMTFFEYIRQNQGDSFELPIPFSDLADYLAVDRSAMMRELKDMNKQGLVISDKKKITLPG